MKKLTKPVTEITVALLEVVVMPNNEVISMGKTLGWFKDFKGHMYTPVSTGSLTEGTDG